jgi:hypothetical protein
VHRQLVPLARIRGVRALGIAAFAPGYDAQDEDAAIWLDENDRALWLGAQERRCAVAGPAVGGSRAREEHAHRAGAAGARARGWGERRMM